MATSCRSVGNRDDERGLNKIIAMRKINAGEELILKKYDLQETSLCNACSKFPPIAQNIAGCACGPTQVSRNVCKQCLLQHFAGRLEPEFEFDPKCSNLLILKDHSLVCEICKSPVSKSFKNEVMRLSNPAEVSDVISPTSATIVIPGGNKGKLNSSPVLRLRNPKPPVAKATARVRKSSGRKGSVSQPKGSVRSSPRREKWTGPEIGLLRGDSTDGRGIRDCGIWMAEDEEWVPGRIWGYVSALERNAAQRGIGPRRTHGQYKYSFFRERDKENRRARNIVKKKYVEEIDYFSEGDDTVIFLD